MSLIKWSGESNRKLQRLLFGHENGIVSAVLVKVGGGKRDILHTKSISQCPLLSHHLLSPRIVLLCWGWIVSWICRNLMCRISGFMSDYHPCAIICCPQIGLWTERSLTPPLSHSLLVCVCLSLSVLVYFSLAPFVEGETSLIPPLSASSWDQSPPREREQPGWETFWVKFLSTF